MIVEKDLSEDQVAELMTFVQNKLSTRSKHFDVNDIAIKFIKNKAYKAPETSVLFACYLVDQIYSWGYYPTDLINYLTTFKAKNKFEDIKSREVSARLSEILIELISEDQTARINCVYFKLIGLQHFQNLKSKKLLDKLIQVCLNCIGQYVATDKLIYIILIKLSLKISDDIKEFKVVIAEKVLSMIFMLFSKFANKAFLANQEIIKNYLYYLKLLVTFGKEITDIASCGEVEWDHLYQPIKEEKYDHFSCLVKLLVYNLFLSLNRQNQFVFDRTQVDYHNLVNTSTFRIRMKGQFTQPHSDYTNSETMLYSEKDLECDQYAKNYDTEQEVLEKIKSNSTKILMIFIRNIPELFIGKNLEYILPRNIYKLKIEDYCSPSSLIPHSLCSKNMIANLGNMTNGNMMMYINHLLTKRHADPPASSIQLSKNVSVAMFGSNQAYTRLLEVKNQLTAHLNRNSDNNINIVCAMLAETKPETKAAIIELLCVFQDIVARKVVAHNNNSAFRNYISNENSKQIHGDNIKETGRSIFFLFVLELYLCKVTNLKYILDGMSVSVGDVLLKNMPPALSKNIVDFMIIPILSTCLHTNHEFLKEFEKFIIAAFDAGFSQYFLSKIRYIKGILARNIKFISNQKEPQESFIPKVRIHLLLIDKVLTTNFFDMYDMIPMISNIYIECILKTEAYSDINYYVPMLFKRILDAQKQIGKQLKCGKFINSFTVCDINIVSLQDFSEGSSPNGLHQSKRKAENNSKCDMDMISKKKSPKQLFIELDLIIKNMYRELFTFSTNHNFGELYENNFIHSFTSISSRLIYYINLELQHEQDLEIEECLMTILNKMRNKKNKLILVDYILSNQHMTMFEIRKKMWFQLFDMFKDKVLSVEIVFTNYNIIYGLRDYQQLVNERNIVKIFQQTVTSMKSKNRKLINNCLKIFAYVLGYYSFSILGWIIELEVPNIFIDEMEPNSNKRQTISSLEFLDYTFSKFILHKYSKFNLITMDALWIILNKHENLDNEISYQLVKLVDNMVPTVYEKLINTDSFKLKNLAVKFLLRPKSMNLLESDQLVGLYNLSFSLIYGDPLTTATNKEIDPSELHQLQLLQENSLETLEAIIYHVTHKRSHDEKACFYLEILNSTLIKYLGEICRFSRLVASKESPQDSSNNSNSSTVQQPVIKFGKEHYQYIIGLCGILGNHFKENLNSEDEMIALKQVQEIRDKIRYSADLSH